MRKVRVGGGDGGGVGWVFGISVCRKLWNPWHRAPPPNLLLNSDILNILAIINAFALEKSIKQINMKLIKPFTVLTSF